MKTKQLFILAIMFALICGSAPSMAQKFSNYVIENEEDADVKINQLLSIPNGNYAAVIMKRGSFQDKYSFGLRCFDQDLKRTKDYSFPGKMPSYLRITTFGNHVVVVGFDKVPVVGTPNTFPGVYKIQAHIPGNELSIDEVLKPHDDKSELGDDSYISKSYDGEYLIVGVEEKVNWMEMSGHKFHLHLRVFDKSMKCVWIDELKLEDIGNQGTRVTDISLDYSNGKLYAICFPSTPAGKAQVGVTVVQYDQPGRISKRVATSVFAKMENSKYVITPDGSLIICSTDTPTMSLNGKTGVNKIQFAKISLIDESGATVKTLLFDKEYYKLNPEYDDYSKQIAKPTKLLLCEDGIIYVSDYKEYSDKVYGKNISFIKIGFNGDLIWNKMIMRDRILNSDDKELQVFPQENDYLILYAPLEANNGLARMTSDGSISQLKIENGEFPKEYSSGGPTVSDVIRLEDGRFLISAGIKYSRNYYFALRTLDLSGVE